MKTVLIVASGNKKEDFPGYHRDIYGAFEGWKIIFSDINPEMDVDIISDMRDLKEFEDNSVDAVVSTHSLEHLHPLDAIKTMKAMHRVVRPGGTVRVVVPDLEEACKDIARTGEPEMGIYTMPANENHPDTTIRAIDVIYGAPWCTMNNNFMGHRWGYTLISLKRLVDSIGFRQVMVKKERFRNVAAYCLK